MIENIYAKRNDIIDLIDRGQWKHSWHLPKDKHGFIDWHNEETKRKVYRILIEDLNYIDEIKERIVRILGNPNG